MPTSENEVSVYMKPNEQGVAMFIGGGTVLIARDNQDADWEMTDTQRAVVVARLRSIADRIERSGAIDD